MKSFLQKCHNQWLLNLGNSDNLLTFAPKAKCFYLSSGTEVCLLRIEGLGAIIKKR